MNAPNHKHNHILNLVLTFGLSTKQQTIFPFFFLADYILQAESIVSRNILDTAVAQFKGRLPDLLNVVVPLKMLSACPSTNLTDFDFDSLTDLFSGIQFN